MSVSVVNGFLCYSGCDEAKAQQGKDPHPKLEPDSNQQPNGTNGADSQRVVTFGGALAALNNAIDPTSAVDPASASSSAAGPGLQTQSTINILV